MFCLIPCFPKSEDHCFTIHARANAVIGNLDLLAGSFQGLKERIDQNCDSVAIC